jgi:hypothetical protein
MRTNEPHSYGKHKGHNISNAATFRKWNNTSTSLPRHSACPNTTWPFGAVDGSIFFFVYTVFSHSMTENKKKMTSEGHVTAARHWKHLTRNSKTNPHKQQQKSPRNSIPRQQYPVQPFETLSKVIQITCLWLSSMWEQWKRIRNEHVQFLQSPSLHSDATRIGPGSA